MARTVLLASLSALVTLGCIVPPGDAAQIRALVRNRAAAVARADTAALYRMHDLDFRAVCPLARFRALPREPERVLAVRDIQVRGVRGSATVELDAGGTPRSERRTFIKDGGRWYFYEDASPCLGGTAYRVPGAGCVPAADPSPCTRHAALTAATPHG